MTTKPIKQNHFVTSAHGKQTARRQRRPYAWLSALAWMILILLAFPARAVLLQGQVELLPGLNLVGIPLDPAQTPTMASLLERLGDSTRITAVWRLDPASGLLQRCGYDAGGQPSGEGCTASVSPGEGWQVETRQATTVPYTVNQPCPGVTLRPGLNLVAFPCATAVTSYILLPLLGDNVSIASVQGLDPTTGRWLTTTYYENQPAGTEFPILPGQAYLVSTRSVSTLADADFDGLTNAQEIALGTDPYNPDTDGDTFKDGEEVAAHTDPKNPLDTPAGRIPPDLTPIGNGAQCWWGRVWPTGWPRFPSGNQIKGCVSTSPVKAADCWFGVISPSNPNIVGGMACAPYMTTPWYCGTGGYQPPDFRCGVTPPQQCVGTVPSLLPATDENCTTFCATGYRDAGGQCVNPPEGLPEKEPVTADCDTCGSTGNPELPTDLPVDEEGREPVPQPPSDTLPMAMAHARIFTMHVSQNVSDIPVGYQPPRGPGAYIRLSYNQKDTGQPTSFTYGNVGPKWTLNVISFITDDPASPGTRLARYVAGGGHVDYKNALVPYNSSTGSFGAEQSSKGTLTRIPATGAATSYELRFPSGTKHVYGLMDGASSYPRRIFLTRIIDPQGNTLTFNYDGSHRLTSLTDATGRNTTFSYTASDPLKVTRITDPFGRHADLTYDGSGRLASITDVLGITSSFAYSTTYGGYMSSLTTPYGTTTFNYYETAPTNDPQPQTYQSLEQTDPLGNTRRVVYRAASSLAATAANVPTGVTASGDYSRNNAFVWDEHAYPLAITRDGGGNVTAEDLSKAVRWHWLKNPAGSVSSVPAAVQKPLENMVYINYTGQPSASSTGTYALPTAAGQTLDDATSSVDKATWNALGKPLTRTDAEGRITYYTYGSNNIDLANIWQGGGYLAQYGSYNAQHRPQTYTDAAGQVWSMAWNAAGQLIYLTNPNNETRFWEYDALGRMTRATVPVSVAFGSVVYGTTNASAATDTSYTWDAYDRVRTKTDAGGYVLTYDYDALDRVTRITYPNGSHDDYDFTFQSGPQAGNPSLDLRKVTDRLGRVTTYGYDANRRKTSVTEPVSSGVTRTTSFSYYENGALKELTDGNGNVTLWGIDLQGRPVSKTYAYGTANARTETIAYENTTSRIKSQTDALNQIKTYAYGLDDRITGISYSGAVNPTPNVTITWDTAFPRPTSIVDGTGTTNFTWVGANTYGALKLASIDNVGFTNDTITYTYDRMGRSTTAAISGGNDSYTYDLLGRLATHTTALGTFTYGYLGNTGQIASRRLNGTSISTTWGYDTNTADRRLTTITNSGVTRNYTLSYVIPGGGGAQDPYNIQSLTDTASVSHPWTSQTHGYAYDLADRLLSATQPTPGNNAYAYDKLDNATTITNPGSGTVNPTYNANNQLATYGTRTYSYDANGNTLSGDGAKTYKWDAENRLVEIDYVGGSNKTVFTYDAFNRRVTQAETVSGTTTTTRYLWCGTRICQSRNSSDTVQARYHPEGEYIVSGTRKYVYMPDQLGSVRDVVDAATGNLVAALDYGPYGNKTRSWGSVVPLYQYAGLVYHLTSGLNLATYRALDVTTGRFTNRDPIRERGGINIYEYAESNPLSNSDQLGLDGEPPAKPNDPPKSPPSPHLPPEPPLITPTPGEVDNCQFKCNAAASGTCAFMFTVCARGEVITCGAMTIPCMAVVPLTCFLLDRQADKCKKKCETGEQELY